MFIVFYIHFEHSIGIRAGALAMVSLPKCDPRPFLRWIDLNHLMLLHIFMGATIVDNLFCNLHLTSHGG